MTTPTTYSTREAAAQFPAIIERVRKGETVIVADEGEPAVEIRLASGGRLASTTPATMREKLLELERDGTSVRTTIRNRNRKIGEPIPGALDRFLADRE